MVVIDIETTGLNPRRASIASIGAVDFLNPDNTFYIECRVDPDAHIDSGALAVNGFDILDITNPEKLGVGEALATFGTWLNGVQSRVFAGSNPSFDRGFLYYASLKYHIHLPTSHHSVDLQTNYYCKLLEISYRNATTFEKSSLKTDLVFEFVGLPAEPRPHHALTGAKMEAEAFARLIYGQNLLSEFSQFTVPEYLFSIS